AAAVKDHHERSRRVFVDALGHVQRVEARLAADVDATRDAAGPRIHGGQQHDAEQTCEPATHCVLLATAIAIDCNARGGQPVTPPLVGRAACGYFDPPPTRFAAPTTSSTVKPKYLNSASAGADAPKRSMPITAPSRPTYLRQKSVTPASIATRLRQRD